MFLKHEGQLPDQVFIFPGLKRYLEIEVGQEDKTRFVPI